MIEIMDTPTLKPRKLGLAVVAATIGILVFSGSAAQAKAQPTERPNIILFLVDDLGWQDTSLQLTPAPTAQNMQWRTPNLDALAKRGMRFSNAYAAAPVCTPTRTSLLTGRTPGATHITYWTKSKGQDTSAWHPTLRPPTWQLDGLDESAVTYPRLLADAGYRTIHAGKAHFGAKGTSGDDPLRLGFQVNIGGHAAGQPGSYLARDNFTTSKRLGNPDASTYWDVPGLENWDGGDAYLTEALCAEACLALDDAVRDGVPFYLNFAPYAVHTPLTANARLLPHYEQLQAREATYGTMIESVDNALGALIAKLDELEVTDNTVILFTSDNGGLSAHGRGPATDGSAKHHHNAPLRSGKGSAFEGGTRVPMAVHWPGHTKPGSSSAQPVITYDLFPTFLALAGVPAPTDYAGMLEGEDLSDIFQGGAQLAERPLFWNQPHQWGAPGPGIEPYTAVRQGDWKLIFFHAGPRLALFNLREDVGENYDLAAAQPERVLELSATMQEWIDERDLQLSLSKETGTPIAGPLTTARGLVATLSEQAPNILLLLVDDLGWTDLSGGSTNLGNGSDFLETPHTDRLAAAGLSFSHAYSSGPNCAPSRAALMSGMWAARTGIYTVGSARRGSAELRSLEPVENTTVLDPSVHTLAEALRKGGYRTAHFGKWHLGGDKDGTGASSPLAQGFDVNFGGDKRGNAGGRQFADASGAFALPGLGANGKAGQWVDDRLTDEALAFLEGAREQPFFINMSFFAVHTPIKSPTEDKEHFEDKPKGQRHNNVKYAGIVKSFDDNVGRLVQYLEMTEDPRAPGHMLIDNTLVIFTSDNGGVGGYRDAGIAGGFEVTTNAPLRSGKGALHEGGIRVPLIVRWDRKLPAGGESFAPTSSIDLFPTLLDAAGIDRASLPLDGQSLMGTLTEDIVNTTDNDLWWHFPAYLEAGKQTFRTTPVSAIRRGPWKLLFHYEDRRVELFNLENDLGEARNQAAVEPEVVRTLLASLSDWLRVTDAKLPTNLDTGQVVACPDGSPLLISDNK